VSDYVNAVVVYEEPPKLEMVAKGTKYVGDLSGRKIELIRDQDFGMIPKAKNPSLFKPGAEKVIWAYGLLERYTLETAIEETETGYFFYRFRCDLVRLDGGNEIVVKSGWGCANTRERRNGSATGHDTANSNLKMAKKRAMVDAAISIGRLSGTFTQDIESEEVDKQAKALVASDSPEDYISSKQVQRIFAIAATNGISIEMARELIKAAGYESTKKIKQKDYDAVCKAVSGSE
jgi:hypothetical protein